MNNEFRRRLNEHAMRLVDDIEKHAGFEISVEKNPQPPPSGWMFDPDALGTACTDERAAIYYRNLPSEFTTERAVHELLHLRRYLVESIPRIVPVVRRGGAEDVFVLLENALEHIRIVPLESKYGVDTSPYWDSNHQSLWKRPDAVFGTHPVDIECTCLVAYLEAHFVVKNPHVRQEINERIKAFGFYNEASELVRMAKKVVAQKPRLVKVVLDAMNIDRSVLRLVYFDPKNRRSNIEEIA